MVFEEGAREDPEADGHDEGGRPGQVAAPRPKSAAQLRGRHLTATAPKFVAQLVVDADEHAQQHDHSAEYPLQTHNWNTQILQIKKKGRDTWNYDIEIKLL